MEDASHDARRWREAFKERPYLWCSLPADAPDGRGLNAGMRVPILRASRCTYSAQRSEASSRLHPPPRAHCVIIAFAMPGRQPRPNADRPLRPRKGFKAHVLAPDPALKPIASLRESSHGQADGVALRGVPIRASARLATADRSRSALPPAEADPRDASSIGPPAHPRSAMPIAESVVLGSPPAQSVPALLVAPAGSAPMLAGSPFPVLAGTFVKEAEAAPQSMQPMATGGILPLPDCATADRPHVHGTEPPALIGQQVLALPLETTPDVLAQVVATDTLPGQPATTAAPASPESTVVPGDGIEGGRGKQLPRGVSTTPRDLPTAAETRNAPMRGIGTDDPVATALAFYSNGSAGPHPTRAQNLTMPPAADNGGQQLLLALGMRYVPATPGSFSQQPSTTVPRALGRPQPFVASADERMPRADAFLERSADEEIIQIAPTEQESVAHPTLLGMSVAKTLHVVPADQLPLSTTRVGGLGHAGRPPVAPSGHTPSSVPHLPAALVSGRAATLADRLSASDILPQSHGFSQATAPGGCGHIPPISVILPRPRRLDNAERPVAGAGAQTLIAVTQQSQFGGNAADTVDGSYVTGSLAGGDRSRTDDEDGPREPARVPGGVMSQVGSRPSIAPSLVEATASTTESFEGVYSLDVTIQRQMATLLRMLFTVGKTSDNSIMPFLGVAHFLLAFSHLVGVSSISARSDFYDSLQKAFEHPESMKLFMEATFRCGRYGLHVGGRTGPPRHVTGQPMGLRDDILRARINPRAVKVQWLSRRLSLRVHVDIQRGARSTTGGLSAADRDTLTESLEATSVCTMLRERGCSVGYAKDAKDPAKRRPVAITFRWDEQTSWFADGLEEALVKNLQGALLRGTPALHTDKEMSKVNVVKNASRSRLLKRSEGDTAVDDENPTRKRPRGDEDATPKAWNVGAGSASAQTANGTTDATTQGTLMFPRMEPWSADINKCDALPRGGHVLSFTLPMHMDTGLLVGHVWTPELRRRHRQALSRMDTHFSSGRACSRQRRWRRYRVQRTQLWTSLVGLRWQVHTPLICCGLYGTTSRGDLLMGR